MRIALTGANGQLGQAIATCLGVTHTIVPLERPAFDLNTPYVQQYIYDIHPDLVIHSAAYTNVDGCTRDPKLAYQVNGLGTRKVAQACTQLDIPLVYISTNEIFPGDQQHPYTEADPPRPINAYGASKRAGEEAVQELLTRYMLIRVAWLFGGERNFVRTVLRLAAQNPTGEIRMVADEVGSPTYAPDVAAALARLLDLAPPTYGIYHLTNAGSCSRYELAQAILQQAGYNEVQLTPIRLVDYQRVSTPPPYSVLANQNAAALGITLRPWTAALSAYLQTLPVANVTNSTGTL